MTRYILVKNQHDLDQFGYMCRVAQWDGLLVELGMRGTRREYEVIWYELALKVR